MEFKDKLKELATKAENERQKPNVTEESTKNALVMPFFQALGYDVFNTDEFCPEYTSSFGGTKNARVDYAILLEGTPIAIIECKSCTDTNMDKDVGQLRQYFSATLSSKLGILTNGIEYRFFTDLDNDNYMDENPFFSFSLDTITDVQIDFIAANFRKERLDIKELKQNADKMRFTSRIEAYLNRMISQANEKFTEFVVKESNATAGNVTAAVKEDAKQVIHQAYQNIIVKRAKQKLDGISDQPDPRPAAETHDGIVTTDDELNGFEIIKDLLSGEVDGSRITYKDTKNYFGILLDGNTWKTVCRLYFDLKKKQIGIYNGGNDEFGRKTFDYHTLESPDDIKKYKEELITAVRRYTNA